MKCKLWKVWFLYGDDTREEEIHWIVVGAKNEHLASIKASNMLQSMCNEGHVITKVTEEKG